MNRGRATEELVCCDAAALPVELPELVVLAWDSGRRLRHDTGAAARRRP
jgi:hypothetical protein